MLRSSSMRVVTLLLWLSGCGSLASLGERCAQDAECATGGLCDEGRCAPQARVQKKRETDMADVVRKAADSVEAAGMRVDQGVQALEADRAAAASASSAPGDSGGGVRSVGHAEKAGEGVKVLREDYQRQAAGR